MQDLKMVFSKEIETLKVIQAQMNMKLKNTTNQLENSKKCLTNRMEQHSQEIYYFKRHNKAHSPLKGSKQKAFFPSNSYGYHS